MTEHIYFDVPGILAQPLPFPAAQLKHEEVSHVDDFLRGWIAETAVGTDRLREVVRVYLEYCSPCQVRQQGLELAATYLLWFFVINDMPDDSRKEAVLAATRATLHGHGQAEDLLQAATRKFREQTTRALNGKAPVRLLRYLDQMFDAFSWEIAQSGHAPPSVTYRQYREHTVAVYPYIEIFRLCEGAHPDDHQAAELADIERMSVNLVYLINDLLSVRRDVRKHKLNLVQCVAQERGTTLVAAVAVVEEQLRCLASDFARACESFVKRACVSSNVLRYVEFLQSQLEGTRLATLVLHDRYSGFH